MNALTVPARTGLNVLTQRAASSATAQKDTRTRAQPTESVWTSTSVAGVTHVVLTRNALTFLDLINVSVLPDSPARAISYAKVCE